MVKWIIQNSHLLNILHEKFQFYNYYYCNTSYFTIYRNESFYMIGIFVNPRAGKGKALQIKAVVENALQQKKHAVY